MSYAAGDRLGPYEIMSPLGQGGMGEVYRARDSKLNRVVALKVLPQRFAIDDQRLARFKREAETLATLNHPNIAIVHTIEDSLDTPALVLELVEGPTLADRIARGPLPFEDALEIGRQLIDALDAAHGRGVVHRDFKPANIKVRPDGAVKVLDFGLAKLTNPGTDSTAEGFEAPVITHSGEETLPGTVLGTPAYMSPEQARGNAADKRTDVWAFGVVMFEMLTGQPLFARPTVADTIGAVLHTEPDFERVPPRLRRLLRSCLQKDARLRLRDIADATLLMGDEGGATAFTSSRTIRAAWLVAGLATLVAIAAIWKPWQSTAPRAAPVRFQIVPSVPVPASGASAVSPDGRRLAFLGTGADGVLRVWVRDLDSLVDRPLDGSEVGQAAPPPFWSPDSRFIAFDAGGSLKKIEAAGGLAQTVCALPAPAVGGSWNENGVIVLGVIGAGIVRVSAAGGTPEPVTTIERSQGEFSHLTPVFLPDGRRFFYLRAFRTAPERSGIFVGSLDVAPDQQDRRRVLPTTTSVSYVAHDAGGTLLFLRDGNLMAQAFDDRRTALSGDATLVAERVEAYRDGATMSASTNGVLVYRDAPSYQLTWLDRHGRVIGRLGETGLYQTVSMSADGSRALVSRASSQVASAGQLWLWDFVRQTSSRVSSVDADVAIWSPDASRFIADARTGLLLVPTDGLQPPETVLSAEPGVRRTPTSWSPDGTHLLFTVSNPKTSADLFVLPLVGEKKEIPFLQSEWAESQGQFSPDPRQPLWVAYTSNETGRDEVSVRQFPGGAGKEMVSRGGGHSPLWRADGRELFYIAADGSVMSAEFVNSRLSPPVALLKAPPGFASRDATGLRLAAPWGITPDGQRFLFAASSAPTGVTPFTVVLNWR